MTSFVSAQTTLFSDDFIAPTLDTNKWTVTSFNGGFVTQGAGSLTLNRPNFGQGSFVTTTTSFNEPIKITGSFSPTDSILGVVIRADGTYNPAYYNDPYGIAFAWFFGTEFNILLGGTPTGLFGTPLSYDVSASHTFEIFDFGDRLQLIFDGSTIADIAVDPTLGVGSQIVLDGADNMSVSGPYSFAFGPIAVEAVPEPSTYALLLLSGAASLFALRRRKN